MSAELQAHRPGNACLHEIFALQAAKSPDAIAVDHPSGVMTYGELHAAARSLSRRLRAAGVGCETPVGVRLPSGPDMVTAILGVLMAGAAYLPLDPELPDERHESLLRETGTRLVLDGQNALPSPVATGEEARVGPDNAAYIIYTSGSTGRPKGVVVPHRGVVERILDSVRRHSITPEDRVLLRTPIGFDGSVWEIFVPLFAGATIVLGAGDTTRDPDAVSRAVRDRHVTVLQAVPSMLSLMESGGDRLRLVYAGGERLDAGTAARVSRTLGADQLWNVYGPTECSIGCVEGLYVPGGEGAVPIGGAIDGTSLLILSPAGEPVPDGEPGELYVGGAGVARGYFAQPALTAERFLPDPSGRPGARVYRTGDLVRRLPGGALEFLGRIDQQLKIRGIRVEPGEVEAALSRHPQVKAAAVGGLDNWLVAAVVSAGDVTAAELRDFLGTLLPAEYVPTRFAFVPELPRTLTGKIDRAALAAMPPGTGGSAAPEDPAERLISQVWSEILGGVRAGPDDDFFQLGGYSMLVPKLAARLSRLWGTDVPVSELYSASTVRAQAELLAALGRTCVPITRGERHGDLPLSPGQRRLWFLDRLEPGSPQYVVPFVVTLPAGLERGQVRDALQALASRHEILRTRYTMRDGEPRQVIDDSPAVELGCVDGGLAQGLRTQAGHGFDLADGPVWRAILVDGRRLVLVVHHIACDGLSLKILRRDLLELCAALQQSRDPDLPPLPVQYADYARWQQGRLHERALEYWRDRLAGVTPLELPTDRPRPQRRDSRGAVHTFEIAGRIADPVLELGRQQGATPFMVFMAAFCCLLSRVCGTGDVVLGTPVAGRLRPELDDLAGFFVNTLVLRCDFDGAADFAEVVNRVRRTALEAFTHQELPFEQLIEELRPERDLGLTPLFQVMFELVEEDDAGEDQSAVLESWEVAKFDLTLHLERRADGSMLGVVEYASDLFDPAGVDRLARGYTSVLEGVAAGVPLAELAVMDAAERHRVLVELNDTGRAVPDACVHELIEAQAARTPDAVAVEYGSTRLTYADVDARANGLAARLRGLGVGPDVPVGVLLERSPDLIVALLAVLKAGGCYLPLEPEFPPARTAHLLEAAGARICLVEPEAVLPDGVVPVSVDPAERGRPCGRGADPDNLIAIYYTSGSTGRPKGVAATHRGWINRLIDMQDTMRIGPGDAVLQKTTLVFDDAPVECFWPLMVGARVVLIPPGAHRDPLEIIRAISDHDVTVALFVPSMLELVLEALTPERRARLRALRHVGTSGEGLRPQLARMFINRFGTAEPVLHNHWGVTEASIDSTHHQVGPDDCAAPGVVTIGRPLANNRVYVLDEEMRPLPRGAAGDIYVGGAGLARGYHRAAALTAECFVPDPFERSGRLYRTGDRGRVRADGTIAFLGRTDHQFKIRGIRVELGEIEDTLRSCPGVRDATASVWQAPSGDRRIVGYLVLREGSSDSDVREHVRRQLPDYMIPSTWTCLREIPRTAAGKVDRGALPEPGPVPRTARDGLVLPRNPTEQVLAEIWSKALGTTVGVHDDFFRAGGHSLLAAQVIMQVQDRFDLELPLRTMFEQPTIARLAVAIEDIIRAEIDALAEDEVRAATTSGQGIRT